ncbi:MAG: carbon monoxide dehydrogenase, partial [Rhizobiaceae bacterium]
MSVSSLPAAKTMELGSGVRTKLSHFVRLLRDNGFIVGLAETRDALKVMGEGQAQRPSLLRASLKALFCSRQSDWTKFDELFDAYWLQRGMKSATRSSGAPQKAPVGIQALSNGQRGESINDNPDRVERGEGSDVSEVGQSKREGASRTELLSHTDFRHLTDPDDMAAAHALAERLSKSMRAR